MPTTRDQNQHDPPSKGKQDTPGRPKPSSSRQQTQPGQTTQTGSPEIDSKSTRGKHDRSVAEDADYRDRPSDDGKHGDAQRKPNEGFPRR